MPRVLVTPHMLINTPGMYSKKLEAAGFEVVYPPDGADTSRVDVITDLLKEDISAILASTEPLNHQVLEGSDLRVVARMGVGYDSVDVDAANELGVVVTITPGTLDESVAEQTIALMFGVSRNVVGRDRNVRVGNWPRLSLPRMAGKTIGIVGLGRTGKALVPKVNGLGMNVVAFDPFPNQEFAKEHGVTIVESVEDLFRTADVISLHLPCTPETEGLINSRSLELFKPDAILVNVGRGGLVDEEALYEAMSNGKLLGAALDVFRQEPLPLESPLLKLENLLTCEHMGGLDQESEEAMSCLAAECIINSYQGVGPRPDCIVSDASSTLRPWA